ncbi:uncharacterized protein LOC129580901 [Paramacrobiotus metropolitanus]|uniref:uncharacterized protein LOC129580901 n=1 Tax=Paramacrobiotus metropolitanus TaxID=2943436 RepID=UPI0024464997|nr:uncharacterized protein LOC129580901 [Paramacrobiotus metropolitanus]XP_055327632.1 uncharacterized protein LOC129580901 [Paramacrobiotus metropolitanus]
MKSAGSRCFDCTVVHNVQIMQIDKSVFVTSSYEIPPGLFIRITEHVNMENELLETEQSYYSKPCLKDCVVIDIMEETACGVKDLSDSGIGQSSVHSHLTPDSPPADLDSLQTITLLPSLLEFRDQLLEEFGRFCLDNVTTQADAGVQWPAASKMESWISGLVAKSAQLEDNTSGKAAVDSFLNDLLLFAVRNGPDSLLTALLNLGLVLPGQQLTNNFTALQTAALWRNKSALVQFGHTEPEAMIEGFIEGLHLDYCRASSPLDSTVLEHDDTTVILKPFYYDVPFTLQLVTVLLRLKAMGADVQLWNSLLFSAVKNGQSTLCELLIVVFGGDVNYCEDISQRTPLHVAAARGHFSVFRLLLQHNANPNAVAADNSLPEELCRGSLRHRFKEELMPLRWGRYQTIKSAAVASNLLHSTVSAYDLTVTFGEEGPLIFWILDQPGSEALLKDALKISHMPLNIQHPQNGQSLLIRAVVQKKMILLEALLESGICTSLRDFSGRSALDYAVQDDKLEIVQTMMKYRICWTGLQQAIQEAKSASVSDILRITSKKRQSQVVRPAVFAAAAGESHSLTVLEPGDDINILNSREESPVFLAAGNGQLKALQVFVEYGGDVTKRHRPTMDTVLHAAARGGHADIIAFVVQLICKEKRTICLNALNCYEQTPVYLAAEGGHADALKMLLSLGASCCGYFRDGILLHSRYESVQAVLDAHRLPRQIAIFRSIEKSDLKTLKAMWQSQFDHYFRDHIGDTPLMVAAQSGNLKILDFLLESAEQECRPFDAESKSVQVDKGLDIVNIAQAEYQNVGDVKTMQDASRSGRQNAFQYISGNTETTNTDCVLTIFRDNYTINHVSAINVVDGCCAVHRAIEVGDNVSVVRLLIKKDPFCANIQEHNGFTPLHLAVVLRRKSIIKYLLQVPEVDLYATDLLGRLPEELAWSESILGRVMKTRTEMSTSWTYMCDQQIPLSTADGLSSWTRRFRSVGSGYSDHASGSDLEHNCSRFVGNTSASQDGVQEYLDRKLEDRSRKHQMERDVYESYGNYDYPLRIGFF